MIYVISSKGAYAAKRLVKEARIVNYELRIMDLRDLIACDFKIAMHRGDVLYIRNPYFNGRPDYIPRIIKLAKSFGRLGGRVVDANILRGDLGKGKWQDYKKLKKAGLPIPLTQSLIFNPLSLTYPFIAKWIYGLKGKGTFLIKSEEDINPVRDNRSIKSLSFSELLASLSTTSSIKFSNGVKKIPISIPTRELMVQEYIDADFEYKVITIGYKALPVAIRFKIKDLGFGIDFKNYKVIKSKIIPRIIKAAEKAAKTLGRELAPSPFLPLEGGGEEGVKKAIKIAQRAAKVLGRELAKVDILEKDGKLFILEVNRFPGLESFEKLTKYNAAKEFVKYLKKML